MLQIENSEAIEFLNTLRGKFVISKALYLAIQSLEENEENSKDISDMRYLQDNLFPLYKTLLKTMTQSRWLQSSNPVRKKKADFDWLNSLYTC